MTPVAELLWTCKHSWWLPARSKRHLIYISFLLTASSTYIHTSTTGHTQAFLLKFIYLRPDLNSFKQIIVWQGAAESVWNNSLKAHPWTEAGNIHKSQHYLRLLITTRQNLTGDSHSSKYISEEPDAKFKRWAEIEMRDDMASIHRKRRCSSCHVEK